LILRRYSVFRFFLPWIAMATPVSEPPDAQHWKKAESLSGIVHIAAMICGPAIEFNIPAGLDPHPFRAGPGEPVTT